MQTQDPNTAIDLLASEEVYLERADTGRRLANYIIDLIAFYISFTVIGVIFVVISPTSLDTIAEDSSTGSDLGLRLVGILFYGLFMGTIEALGKGKSLGKLITGTRAVNLDGSPITAGKAFARGFCRAIPFSAFSALGTPCNPWQDKWTDTMVIKERKM
jgi:uncharacterized RDD family membrane protein YckC